MFLRYVILYTVNAMVSINMNDNELLEKFKIFGENVRKNRDKLNMTIKELSDKTGIREQYLKK